MAANDSTPASAPSGSQPPDANVARLPQDTAVVPIYKGGASHWLAGKSYAAALIVIAASVALLIFASLRQPSSTRSGMLIAGLAMLAASSIMLIYIALWVRSTRYTITNRLIEFETGLVVKKVDALDLGRVKHVELVQSFLDRMLNVGTIEVYSSDAEEPKLEIETIRDPRAVYEKLRDAVIDLSRRRGIILE